MEIWRGVSEGLMSCREDIESGEARLAEDVRSFEQRILSANEDIAAKKVGRGKGGGGGATRVREAHEARGTWRLIRIWAAGKTLLSQGRVLNGIYLARSLPWWTVTVFSIRA